MVSENLKKKRIFLGEEDFDILGVLNEANSNAQAAVEAEKILAL